MENWEIEDRIIYEEERERREREVKGTVLKEFQLVARTGLDRDSMLLAQAESTWDIAFKAGYKQGRLDSYIPDFAEGKRTGIREAVEWLESFCEYPKDDLSYAEGQDTTILETLTFGEWRAKLKEWGI